MIRAVLVGALCAGACIAAARTGTTCDATSDCGDGFECVFVPARAARVCLPAIDRARTSCVSVADCDAAGFPVEADCVDGSCACAPDDVVCPDDADEQTVMPFRCGCVESGGRGGFCADDAECDSLVCVESECQADRGGLGDPCGRNEHCEVGTTCVQASCALPPGPGDVCDDDEDCPAFEADQCVNARCREQDGTPGTSCGVDGDCLSLSCDPSFQTCD